MMNLFKEDDCTTLKTDEGAISKIDFELNVMDRKSYTKEANFSSFKYKDWARKFTDGKYSAVLWNDLSDELNQLQNILKPWNGNDNYCKRLFKRFRSTNEYKDMIPIIMKQALYHDTDIKLDILKYQNSHPSQYYYIIATQRDKIDKGTRNETMAAAIFISEAEFTLSDGSYGRYDAMFETAFANTLTHHLNRISEPIENLNQIYAKIMQTEQKALYEEVHLLKKKSVLDRILRTQKKKIDQEIEMSELIAKVITKIDQMIKAGKKVSEAFIMDICDEIIGNVSGIIEASNSFVDIWNRLVGIIKEHKAVHEARNERIFADNVSHACTDNHIEPERHKSKNTKLKSNEHIPHVFDLAGEIRKLSKSLLDVVSGITPTLLQLGLQVLKRMSYLWMSDNDLNLSKNGEIEDYGLDFQCPLLPSNKYMKRMSTFKSKNNAKGVIWNEETIVKPEQLVGAGFSFDGKQDHVRCTSCECTSDVSQWNRNDEEYALSIHKGLAKDCNFVKTYGGSCTPEYVLPD